MAAGTPSVVPTMARVNGKMKTSRMMNGSERIMFTAQPSTPAILGCGRRPLGDRITSATPRTMPMT